MSLHHGGGGNLKPSNWKEFFKFVGHKLSEKPLFWQLLTSNAHGYHSNRIHSEPRADVVAIIIQHLEGNKNKNQFIEMFEFVFDVDFEDIENIVATVGPEPP